MKLTTNRCRTTVSAEVPRVWETVSTVPALDEVPLSRLGVLQGNSRSINISIMCSFGVFQLYFTTYMYSQLEIFPENFQNLLAVLS